MHDRCPIPSLRLSTFALRTLSHIPMHPSPSSLPLLSFVDPANTYPVPSLTSGPSLPFSLPPQLPPSPHNPTYIAHPSYLYSFFPTLHPIPSLPFPSSPYPTSFTQPVEITTQPPFYSNLTHTLLLLLPGKSPNISQPEVRSSCRLVFPSSPPPAAGNVGIRMSPAWRRVVMQSVSQSSRGNEKEESVFFFKHSFFFTFPPPPPFSLFFFYLRSTSH